MDNQHTVALFHRIYIFGFRSERQKLEHIMRQLESLNPSIRLHEKEIEKRFCKLSHTPDHPPYASMIQKALSELNDQEGSSEEAISKFIETEYDDLPFAHASYLSHHLRKLITKGEIVYTSANCYLLPCKYSDSVQKSKGQKQLRKFRQGRPKGRLRTVKGVRSQQNQTIEEGQEHNQACEKISERAEEQQQSEEQRIGLIAENKEPGDTVLIEEVNEVEEAQCKMVEDEQYKEAEEYDLLQEQHNRQQMELNVQESQVEGNAVDKEGHRARKNDEVTEMEIREAQKDLVTEEPLHSEQNSEKPGDSNVIRDPESEAREGQVESADIQIETKAEEINSQEQCQVLCKTIEGTREKQSQEEESHQVRTSGEVTEKVVQEVREDVVIEGALLIELRSETTPVESNPIRELESEGREAQAEVADVRIESMDELQGQCLELSCEEKKLQELQMEVCHQIMDLSNSLVHFVEKKKEDKATASTQYDSANLEDHFRSSHLKKEEVMELLKKTYKIGAKLNDIMEMDVLEHNNLKPTQQKNSLENHPQQTKETCLHGSESSLLHDCQPQQHEICGQLEVSESQPKTILASDSVPTSLMGFEQSCQIELPTCKRPPEVEITVLEGLNGDQNKQVKLCGQQKAFVLQLNSLHDKNENSQGIVESTGMVLEENRESPTTEPNINSLGKAAISRPETETSSVDMQFIKKLPESQPVTSSVELQAVDLGKQAELQKTKSLPTEIDLSITDTNLMQVEGLSPDHQQEITLRDVAIPPGFKLGEEQQPERLVEGRPTEHELTQQQMQGQTLQEPLPPLHQMLSKGNVTRATSIAKQRVWRKKMPDEQQLKKLRPRGPRASEHEPVLTTVGADNDFTLASWKAKLKRNPENRRLKVQGSQTEVEISQSTEQVPLNRESQRKHGHKAVVKISQRTEQPVNHHGQTKQLKKSQPTTITTVDSDSTSQQQTQEQPHSQSESVVVKSTEESLPLGNLQSEQVQQKLQCQRRGRPPKVKPDFDPSASEQSVLNDQHHVQKKSPLRTQGRPFKKKANADASMKKSLIFHEEQQKKHDKGSPSKKETDVDAGMKGSSMFLDHHKHQEQQQKRAPGRHSKRKTNADASMEGSLLSDHQNHEEQQQRRAQGRPSEKKRNADAGMEGSSKRARGRPAKSKLSSNVDLVSPPTS